MTDDKIIDFEARKDRRRAGEFDQAQVHWDNVVTELFEVMARSELPDVSVTSAALRALLDRLEEAGMSRHDAKAQIAGCLKVFQE
jgi:hypothetical protein